MSDDAATDAPTTEGSTDGAELVEVVRARGHENVSAEHVSTLEFTSDDFLTPAGDCILAIEADRVPADFDDAFVDACRAHGATITATIEAAGHTHEVTGRGHPDFSFENERSHVIRTSDYVDDRTVIVGASGAAADVDRELVAALADGADATLTLEVEPA
ncbi:DUF371 domain-containing protein [Halosimplex rubrum]|uniref:DUF371 domain-containing protein n=1 Tax=Halosimplex rubrum TaxID=869889 RepID=A0A7D5P581_9EURY|nr:DUF371 domain-containing protein [Halosimplex rubrum]QLH77905.1 DUF371 domain-containing protein [Halosimplex rubrum]